MFSRQSSEFSYYESFTHDSQEFHSAVSLGERSKLAGFQSGDPYCELDDVTRGVSVAQPLGLDAFAPKDSCMDRNLFFLTGDDYEFSSLDSKFLCVKPVNSFEKCHGSSWAPESEIFQAQHVPPSPPSSEHFFFVPTTLFLKDCCPQEIGNSLLEFFRSQVVASITKVTTAKYAVKAEVFVDGSSCMMKVRVYTQGDRYAVELQRRGGDAFILQSTYQLLSDHLGVRLGSHTGSISGVTPKSEKPLALPVPAEPDSAEEVAERSLEVLSPLLAMAAIAGLQAEAASALAKMANGGRTAAAPLLESPDQVALALTHLLASGQIDVVYPAARCLSGLAAFGEAGPLLAHEGLLKAAASQAVAELAVAQGLVGTALARAVIDSVQCCAGWITSATATDIQEVLDAGLKSEALTNCDVLARTHLEQALFDTSLV